MIILIAVIGAMNIICFIVGAKVGQTVATGEKIKTLDPVRSVIEHMEEQANREEQEIFETNMANIENYNGTPLGQKDFR